MSTATATADVTAHPDSRAIPGIVVIGAGPVGIRLIEQLGDRPVTLFDDEEFEPYDRVQLSAILTGQRMPAQISNTAALAKGDRVRHRRARVVRIDRHARCVYDDLGGVTPYEKLVIATGSTPAVPSIPGMDLSGVFVFRNMADTQRLVARRTRSHHTVVLGGGLLGIEAARGMQRLGTRVTLVEHNSHLMFRQLDDASGEMLSSELADRGIDVRVATSVRMVLGTTSVQGVLLGDGTELPCDTLVVAAGIRPNVSLARDAGIAVGRGIGVDERMQTSDPDVYAIGECCEFAGEVYGIVAPGYEQAAIAARSLQGAPAAYRSAVLATSLKVSGLTVVSMGETDPHDAAVESHVYRSGGVYRRVNTRFRRLVGVIAIGDWPALVPLREHLGRHLPLMPWTLAWFRRTGALWDESAVSVRSWPAQAVLCNCNLVSKAEITAAIAAGADSIQAIGAATGSGTTCGTCRALLGAMLRSGSEREPVGLHGTLAVVCAILFVTIAAALLLPGAPYTQTVQLDWRWDVLWTSGDAKRASGFTLLGLSALALVLAARKRLRRLTFGGFDAWRLLHASIGVLCFAALGVHTGFRFGSNLNFVLMSVFVALSAVGVLLGLAIASEHRLGPGQAVRMRRVGLWSHVLLCWPVPPLLAAHLLKTFYF